MVSKEWAVVPPGPPAGLLQHHHGLGRVDVAQRTVPVIPL